VCAAFLVQGVAVQSHVHAASAVAATAGASAFAEADGPSGKDSGKASDACWLCREAATGGHYLLPQAGFELPPAPPVQRLALPALARWSLRRQSLGWSGRPPPK
jgi:hypothetical protein